MAARKANSLALWRDLIAVPAYRGRELAIANMVHYSCELTERYIRRALEQPDTFTAEDLRVQYLEAQGPAAGATVPMNKVTIATFFLVGMDIGHRVIQWFDRHEIDWPRAMVVIVGRQGRPTAGVTWPRTRWLRTSWAHRATSSAWTASMSRRMRRPSTWRGR